MNIQQSFKDLMKITQTKIGLVFAIFVPLFFVIVWMTGYHGATDRIDQLQVAIVNEDGVRGEAIQQGIADNAPFQVEMASDLEEAQARMDKGDYSMVIAIPADFTQEMSSGAAVLTFYVNQAGSEVAISMLEQAALQLTDQLGQQGPSGAVQANVVKMHGVADFATSMLPMLLGFISYIAMMTMNIQFNISSQIMKRNHSKWEIFWSRQILLALIAIVVPFIITGAAMLFTDVASSFMAMWGFHVLVFAASIAVTQMSFALFGNAGPLFNVALVPIQLMTAGNIIPQSMLAPFYRHIGSFLPAPNAIQGYLKLIYNGESVTTYVINLILIALVAWVITVVRVASEKKAVAGGAAPANAAH